jgi:2-isopropylmalate synthase
MAKENNTETTVSDPAVDGVDANRVYIFDTTLRDGEQSPGASLTSAEKLEIARQLSRLGVDIMEAGFPAASPDDLLGVQRIAQEIGTPDGPVITGLARATKGDIDKAWEAVQYAAKPRIHTFLATSDIHMEHKLRMTREEVVARTREMVAYAKSYCDDIEFSPEDAGRSDPDFLIEVLAVAIESGATTLNIPDTVGYITPDEYYALMDKLIRETPGGDSVIWSVHCHDDLGFATANTMAGIRAGARQAEVTINGIGERAGNTSLEEVAMALHTRRPYYGLYTGIDTTQIIRTSRMVSNYTGMTIQPNKAIVGRNAFAHEAGIHQDGILKNQRTYEIMTPETVGLNQSRLVLGKHSGRHAFRVRMEELGLELTKDQLQAAFARFKDLADKKKTVTDADLEALVADEFYGPAELYKLMDLQVACGNPGMPTATVRLEDPDGAQHTVPAIGTGPVDAAFAAIDQVVKANNTLIEYSVHSITEGIDAMGEVTVRITTGNGSKRTFGGYGADTDIIIASAKAYLEALNRMLAITGSKYSQPEGAASAIGVSTVTS